MGNHVSYDLSSRIQMENGILYVINEEGEKLKVDPMFRHFGHYGTIADPQLSQSKGWCLGEHVFWVNGSEYPSKETLHEIHTDKTKFKRRDGKRVTINTSPFSIAGYNFECGDLLLTGGDGRPFTLQIVIGLRDPSTMSTWILGQNGFGIWKEEDLPKQNPQLIARRGHFLFITELKDMSEKITVENKENSVFQKIKSDYETSDITILVKDGNIKAHKAILRSASPYLKNMCTKSITSIDLSLLPEVNSVINYIYGFCIHINDKNILDLVKIAQLFELDNLLSNIKRAIKNSGKDFIKTMDMAISLFNATTHKKLQMAIIKFSTKTFSMDEELIKQHPNFTAELLRLAIHTQ